MDNKSFCKGLFCRKSDRHKCTGCGTYSCAGCSEVIDNKHYCIDCAVPIEWKRFIDEIKRDWDSLPETNSRAATDTTSSVSGNSQPIFEYMPGS